MAKKTNNGVKLTRKEQGLEQISLVVTREMHLAFHQAAAFSGFRTLSPWMRTVLAAKAEEILKNLKPVVDSR